MTIYVISQDYTLKKLYGFVPYQSRTLLAMSYTRHIHMSGICETARPADDCRHVSWECAAMQVEAEGHGGV